MQSPLLVALESTAQHTEAVPSLDITVAAMSNNRHSGKSVRFNEGSQQPGSSRHHRREDERDSGLGSSSSEHTSHRRGRPDWGFTAADRHYQSNNPDALREAYATLLAQNENLQGIIAKHEASLSTSHRTIKQLESHATGLVTEKDELKAKNNDYKDEIKGYKAEIAKLQSENDALQRDNMDWQVQVADLHEQMIMRPVVSDQMSGGASGASGTSGSSSNKISRRPSQRESQDERLKDRFNRSTQNNAPVASTSAIPHTPQRQRRPSKVTVTRPYIEEPEPRYNLVARPAPGLEQARVPRSSHQNPGDYQFHPLPQEPRRR